MVLSFFMNLVAGVEQRRWFDCSLGASQESRNKPQTYHKENKKHQILFVSRLRECNFCRSETETL